MLYVVLQQRVAGVIDSPAITVKSVDEIASDSDIICTTTTVSIVLVR